MARFKITVSEAAPGSPGATQCVVARMCAPSDTSGPVAHQCINGSLISAFSASEADLASLRSDLGALAPLTDA